VAQSKGVTHLDIKAGDLHKKLEGYPGPNHRMPDCCQVMKRLMQKPPDMILSSPPRGQGASLIIRYFFPRASNQ
jgi:5-methylcytosine-specific restriction protein A